MLSVADIIAGVGRNPCGNEILPVARLRPDEALGPGASLFL